MPGNTVGSADFLLLLNLESFNAGFQAAQRQAEAGSSRIAQSIDGSLRKSEQSAARFGESFKRAFEIGGAIAGVTVGLATVNAALEKVANQTQKTLDLQFQLGKVYGASAAAMTKSANDLAAATGKSNLSVQEGVARFAVLERGYGLTREQTEKLAKATLDLAAVTGTDTVEAFERMIGVFRDGGESVEKLGLVLNDQTVKAFANLTAEQRKNFEQMDAVTKSQIRYTEAMKQAAFAQGSAAEKANSQAGAMERLKAATDNLAASFGAEATRGSGGGLVGGLANAVSGLNDFIARAHEAEAAVKSLHDAGRAGFTGGLIDILLHPEEVRRRIEELRNLPGISGPDPGMPGGTTGGLNEAQARAAIIAARQRQRTEAQQILNDRKDAIEARAAMEVRAIEQRRKIAEDAYAHDRAILEQTKNAEVKAAEDSRDGQLRAIDAEAKATAKRYDGEIRDAERARDAAKQAADDKKDAALKALDAEQQAVHDASDAQIRDLEIQRDRRKQAAEDTRDAGLRALDDQKRARDNARIQEDREADDHNTEVQRRLDEQAKAAERRFQRESDAAERAHQKDIDGIERASQKEQDRHQKALAAIQDEQDARIAALDVQLKALDAQERQTASAERLANLQRTAASAQEALTRARGTGTADEIAQARGELTRALRGGDEVSVANARERLQLLAGSGAAAVKKAEQDLADATQAIQDEQTKQTNDAIRDRLNAEKDAIKQQADSEKQAEDARNQRRTRELAADKKSADDKYRAAKDGIDKRKQDEKDAHDVAVQQARDVAEQAKRAVQDRRRAEDQADQDKRREITDTYDLEQRQIKATYDDEETGSIPAIRRAREAADRDYAARRDTVNQTYQAEQDQIKATYDGPDGLIQHLHDQASVAAEEYGNRKTAVNDAYQAERDRIAEVYDDPVHGLFANLEAAKQKTIDSLDAQKDRWETWKNDTVKNIQDALDKLDEFLTRVGALQQIGTVDINGNPVQNNPGGRQGGPGGDLAYGPVVRNASPDSYWTSGGTHGGYPAADIFAPSGSPIYAPVGGTITTGSGSLGGNYAILTGDDGRSYYFAHGNVPFASGRVERGAQIGEVGNTGNAAYTASHLHFAIASNSGFFGDHNGSGDISGDSSYWGEGGTANARGGDDQEITIDVLGRKIRVRMSRNGAIEAIGPNGNDSPTFQRLLRQATSAARKYDLPASIMAAIPINEGLSSQLQTQYHNLFSIKGVGPAGSVTLPTDEIINGQRVTINDAFRVYHSEAESFEDFGRLVTQSGIYDDAVQVWRTTHDAGAFMRLLGRHYATDPNFSEQVLRIAGYENGTLIAEPTLLYGLRSGSMGVAGETGQPERLLGVDDTRAYGRGGDVTTVSVNGVGLSEVANEIMRRIKREQLLRGGRYRG